VLFDALGIAIRHQVQPNAVFEERLEPGSMSLAVRVIEMSYIASTATSHQLLVAGGWRLAAGGWRLAAGGWWLVVGGW
jgi:hypothetical protein